MLSLTDRASVSRALSDTALDLDLRALIGLRAWQLHVERGLQLGTGFRIIVVQGGDTPSVINAALGLHLTGAGAESLAYDWIEDHGLWFEISYGATGDAQTRVFVENGPGTELGIHALCLAHFWPSTEERRG
jgi:phosphoserine aminotransferase